MLRQGWVVSVKALEEYENGQAAEVQGPHDNENVDVYVQSGAYDRVGPELEKKMAKKNRVSENENHKVAETRMFIS